MPVLTVKLDRQAIAVTTSTMAIIAAGLMASSASAQSSEGSSATSREVVASDIVVTGVRGKPRTVLDSPTPVDVISAKDLATTGHANVYQDLQVLIPSFNQPAKAGSSTSSAILTGSLRGLNPDHTLILINGQRWHNTALINVGNGLYNGSVPVDLGLIPSSAIGAMEVLREGAAAQYGSDAIAGVINIRLKDTEGGSISAQYGQNFDRSDGELLIVRGDYGLKFGDAGKLNLYFQTAAQQQSDRSFDIASTVQLYPRINGQPDPREATVSRRVNNTFGAFPYKQLSTGYNASYDSDAVQIYSFGMLSRRVQDLGYPLVIPNNANSIPQLYPNGVRPLLKLYEWDGQAALGVRGEIRGWDWNLSSTYGQDRLRENALNTLNASVGPTSQTDFYLGTLISRLWTNSLDLTRQYDAGEGSLQVSLGGQHRREAFKTIAGEPNSYIRGTYVIPAGQPFAGTRPTPGSLSIPGFQPSDAGSWKRDIVSGYLELGWDPTSRFFLGSSGRYEHFSDSAGGSLVGKISSRYKLTEWFALRGSFGNGFHAPSLIQSHYSNTRNQVSTAAATLNQTIISATLPVNSPAALALGAEPLKPEKSIDGSLGFTMNPARNFSLSVDGYIVTVKDRIALTGILSGAAVNNILVAAGLQPNLSAQYFTNAIDTRTKGVDVVSTYRTALGNLGGLRLTAAFNYNKTTITDVIPNPSALTALGAGYTLIDRVTSGYLTSGIPKTKAALSANWDIGPFEINIQEIRYGKFSVLNNTPANDRTFGSKFITNLSVRYNLSSKVSIIAGAENIFNSYPEDTAIARLDLGYNQYPRTSPYGFTGGNYYGRVQIEF